VVEVFPSGFPTELLKVSCPRAWYMPYQSHITPTVKSGPTNCEPSYYSIFSSLRSFVSLGPNILLGTCSQTSSIFPRARDQFPRPYKAIRKITHLYILIFTLIDRTCGDKFSEKNCSKGFPEFNQLLVWSFYSLV
jgi:hypothetical protein